jgi:hypothetical protein
LDIKRFNNGTVNFSISVTQILLGFPERVIINWLIKWKHLKEVGVKSIQKIEAEVRKLAININAPDSLLRVYAHPKGDGTPHIEIHGDVYHYISGYVP